MTSTLDSAPGLSGWLHRLAVYQYFDQRVAGSDVLEVDADAGVGARFLAGLGARRVVGVDPSEAAVARARASHALTNLEFRVGTAAVLEFDDDQFDVVFVNDGARVLRRSGALEELRRVLRATGSLVLSARSADRPAGRGGASYFDIIQRLTPQFGAVRLFAQAPFAGTTLVAYDANELQPELDPGLLELQADDEVTHYVAVTGDFAVSRGFSIAQMPIRSGVRALAESLGVSIEAVRDSPSGEGNPSDQTLARLREVEAALARTASPRPSGRGDDTVLRLDRALAEARSARRRIAELERAVEEAQLEANRTAVEAATEVASKRKDLEIMRKRLAELEDRSARMPGERSPTELVAEAMTVHAAAMRDLEAQLDERRAMADEVRDERDRARAEAREAREQLAAARERLEAADKQLSERRRRSAVAEGEVLRERARRERAEAAASELQSELGQTDERRREADEQRNAGARRVEELERERLELRRQVEELLGQSEHDRKELRELRHELVEIHAELANPDAGPLRELETLVASKESELVKVRERLADSESRLAGTEERLADARKELAIAHTELNLLKRSDGFDDVSQLRGALEETRDELARAYEALADEREASGRDADDRSEVPHEQLASAVERLEDLERTLQAERDVALELERALQAVRQQARVGAGGDDEAPKLRARAAELLDEIGQKDAEIMILQVGVEGLRARLRELVEAVSVAQRDMAGQSEAGMAAVMSRLTASLEPFRDA